MDTKTTKYIKPFSNEWWTNLWYYYKWHILGGIFALICIIVFLTECVFTVKPDFSMSYIGGMETIGQIEAYKLEDVFAPTTQDINRDGKKVARVNIIYLDKGVSSQEMSTNFQLADVEMMGGDSIVYLFDEEYLERYSKYGYYELNEWAEKYRIDESNLKRYEDGRVYAINLRGNPLFEQIEEIKTDGLYLAVRPLRENDRTDWQRENYENGLNMAEYIISGGTSAN